MKTPLDFPEAMASYNRVTDQEYVALGEKERKQILELFPRGSWADMPIEKYALGQSESENTFCVWLKYRSPHLGSISGGSAKKLLIYKRRKGEGWYFDPSYGSVEEAWEKVRAAFVRAFELAQAGEWAAIDELKPILADPQVCVKTLHIYFRDHILPVASRSDLLHFLKQLRAHTPEIESADCIALNQALANAVFSKPEFKDWTTNEVERFLHWWSDPRESRRVVKIAPGERAKHWQDCLEHDYIRVGWDKVGDLRKFADKEEFDEEFRSCYGSGYRNRASTIKRKGNELWKLTDLEEGDVIIANRGISRILAVGEVVSPAYEWKPNLPEDRHTVRVKWDTSYEQDIERQGGWGVVTVAKVPPDLYERILAKSGKKKTGATAKPSGIVDPFYTAAADALGRKRQLILYGPPGTGKTYVARRFAVWWMLEGTTQDANAVLANQELFSAEERRLTTTVNPRHVWWAVANPKEWTWEVLFNEGSDVWHRGKIRKHYAVIRPGDLVVGYQANPDKRIVAIAKVSKTASQLSTEDAGFEVVPICRIVNGPSHSELLKHPILKDSEPLRHNNQGTLFALTPEEVEELADMIGESDPKTAKILTEETLGVVTWTTFHPSYAYEDFVEGLRPYDTGDGRVGLKLEDGLFKRICRAAEGNPAQKYLLIIDEINRANVSKVFGELITVLEGDKRGLPVVLPQSKQSFVVPPNLYILATMNTADRSIRLLDSALRRRFAFLELMPDSQKLQGASVGGLALDDLMETINARIAKRVGREKQLGHSYFLDSGRPVTDPDQFAQRFHQEILPVLQEYCYEDYGTLAQYLGSKLVNAEDQKLNEDVLTDPTELIAALEQVVAEDKAT